jgi:tRNA A37 threonylcarbamoyltransferase TsaD
VDEHARFGGVVPEVASRAHLEAMTPTAHVAVDQLEHGTLPKPRVALLVPDLATDLRPLGATVDDAAGIRLRVPQPKLCTDNGAMVAALGADLVCAGLPPSALDLPADSSLPHHHGHRLSDPISGYQVRGQLDR